MKTLIRTGIFLISLLSFLLAGFVPEALAVPNRMISGPEALEQVKKLTTEIPWYTSLSFAKKKAWKEGKPIFWVHMLGQMNGYT